MSGGVPDDVYRSLRRYVSLMLGSPPWTVRLQRVRVADDDRPVAVLEPGVRSTTFSREGSTGPQGDQQKSWPITVMLYPELGVTAMASAETARHAADLLEAGFSRGLVTDALPPVNIGAPWRLPVYDFAGVPVEGATRAGPQTPYQYANVVRQTFNVRPIQDAMDELRYSIAASMTVTWWQGGRIPLVGPIAGRVAGVRLGPDGLPVPPAPSPFGPLVITAYDGGDATTTYTYTLDGGDATTTYALTIDGGSA